jgi:hypothetical protein
MAQAWQHGQSLLPDGEACDGVKAHRGRDQHQAGRHGRDTAVERIQCEIQRERGADGVTDDMDRPPSSAANGASRDASPAMSSQRTVVRPDGTVPCPGRRRPSTW